MVTKSLSEFGFGSGKGIGSEGDVKTKIENMTAIAIAPICIRLSITR